MKKIKKSVKTKKPKVTNAVLYNFDSIKLNNPALLNDQKISAAYTEFLFKVNEAFETLFQK
jgi:hypothetical protein